MKLLFVDCCISQRGEESRTHKLAEAYLKAYLDRHPEAELETVFPEELLELAQKAKFSQHKLTREELRAFTVWLKAARRELMHASLPRRLWCRYVLARW